MISANLYLDKRRPLKDGIYPLKLRITNGRKSRLYSLEIDNKKVKLDEECYAKLMGVKPHFELNILKKRLNNIIDEVNGYISSMENFTFSRFETIYKKKILRTVKDYFDHKIGELRERNSIRTAHLYDYTYKSLVRFDKNLISLRQITPDFLENYERDFLKNGGSATSVGMYLRNVRAIMNQAKDEGILKLNEYPFGRKKYVIPAGSKSRQILTHEQIKDIYKCEYLNPLQEKARDFWVFSFLANGMNMIDILLLKYKNYEGDTFSFIRHKTKNTTKSNPMRIKVIITDPLKNIINKWGNPDKSPDNFIFPVLTQEPTTEADFSKVESFIRFVNQHMETVTQKLGLPKVSTYTARHSYATEMLKNKANIVEIADSLGHTTITLTRDYINSLDEGAKRHYANKLAEL